MTGTAPVHQGIFLGYLARKAWKPEPYWDPEGKTGVVDSELGFAAVRR